MSKILYEIKQKDGFSANSPRSTPDYSSNSASSSDSRISPVLLLIIIVLAALFFICGLLHLLIRCLFKKPSFSAIYHSNRYPADSISGSHSFTRQLQQLFRLHDSGLDQSCIDALPVFTYKDIDVVGLKKEPFDCAVCLCKFSAQDKLRLLHSCSHAFHIGCIDTWLLSNSTCPFCRGPLSTLNVPMELNYDIPRDGSATDANAQNTVNIEEIISSEKGCFRLDLVSSYKQMVKRLVQVAVIWMEGDATYQWGDISMWLVIQMSKWHYHKHMVVIIRSFSTFIKMKLKISGRRKGESLSVSKKRVFIIIKI